MLNFIFELACSGKSLSEEITYLGIACVLLNFLFDRLTDSKIALYHKLAVSIPLIGDPFLLTLTGEVKLKNRSDPSTIFTLNSLHLKFLLMTLHRFPLFTAVFGRDFDNLGLKIDSTVLGQRPIEDGLRGLRFLFLLNEGESARL